MKGLREFKAEGLPWLASVDPDKVEAEFEEFVRKENSKITFWTEAPPVRETELWCIIDDEYVGRISIRHELNESLRILGGHIGYDVRPGFRGKGIATLMLKLALPIAKSLGISEALLTCEDSNTASIRVIEKNGGRLDEIKPRYEGGALKRYYWISL